jgi:hypothetical protein
MVKTIEDRVKELEEKLQMLSELVFGQRKEIDQLQSEGRKAFTERLGRGEIPKT